MGLSIDFFNCLLKDLSEIMPALISAKPNSILPTIKATSLSGLETNVGNMGTSQDSNWRKVRLCSM